MPRPKVDEKSRRRIAHACSYCKAVKQKCDGISPCVQCVKRGRAAACEYALRESSHGLLRRRHRLQVGKESNFDVPSLDKVGPGPQSNIHNSEVVRRTDISRGNEDLSELVVPRMSQVLYNNKGEPVYLGDGAALSFLQNIQKLIVDQSEPTSPATDILYQLTEETPVTEGDVPDPCSLGTYEELKSLVEVYFTSTGGLIDIFDKPKFMMMVDHWASGHVPIKSGVSAVLYLVIAYGAQARSASVLDNRRAQSFYHHGRQTSLLELTSDPNLETVQAFLLISMYMLGCGRRNGAFLNLGIAISAATSLGFHRDEPDSVLGSNEKRLRARVWKSLRFHDLFFCAMMGRTSAINGKVSNISYEQRTLSQSTDDDSGREMAMAESTRAFLSIERIINEVYTQRTVSLRLLHSIAKDLREWSSRLPAELRTSPTSCLAYHSKKLPQDIILRNSQVACSYYFVMMLLMRPFLITNLRAEATSAEVRRARSENSVGASCPAISKDIIDGSIACIDSAVYTLQLLHELMVTNMLFKNMPLVVAWVFVAGLVVSSAHFGGIGSEKDVEQATQKADNLLKYFAAQSPQAVNYHRIVVKLSKAAVEHRDKLKQDDLKSRTVAVPRLFRLTPDINDTPITQNAVASEPGPTSPVETWDLWPQPHEGSPNGSPMALKYANNTFSSSISVNRDGSSCLPNLSISARLEQPHGNRFNETEGPAQTFSESLAYGMNSEYDALMCLGNGNDILDFYWGGSL